jgi:malate dehydrogenase (oxaloacetate-decarboxylating)(NADP+)
VPFLGLQVPFAHDVPYCKDLESAVKQIKPTVLIGVSTMPHAFDQTVINSMAELNDHPIIFPLSNPTSKAECSYEEAVRWTHGSVLFASGSPFPALCCNGEVCHPAQVRFD